MCGGESQRWRQGGGRKQAGSRYVMEVHSAGHGGHPKEEVLGFTSRSLMRRTVWVMDTFYQDEVFMMVESSETGDI